MGCPRAAYGLSVECPWVGHGLPVNRLWAVRGVTISCPWVAHGLSMVWTAHVARA